MAGFTELSRGILDRGDHAAGLCDENLIANFREYLVFPDMIPDGNIHISDNARVCGIDRDHRSGNLGIFDVNLALQIVPVEKPADGSEDDKDDQSPE